MATTKNVRWVAKLGSQAYGNPTISGGKVFVGTNNESPRDPKFKGDYSMLMVFDETSGKYLWQLAVPKLGTGKVSDWEFLGLCSSPHGENTRGGCLLDRMPEDIRKYLARRESGQRRHFGNLSWYLL